MLLSLQIEVSATESWSLIILWAMAGIIMGELNDKENI